MRGHIPARIIVQGLDRDEGYAGWPVRDDIRNERQQHSNAERSDGRSRGMKGRMDGGEIEMPR
jgi:hypothetical protein